MKIGFQNFRRFINFKPVECKGITFLVGRNNAGKSTLEKALLLINGFFKSGKIDEFSFGNKILEDANIVTYGRAKCRNAKNDFINFYYFINSYYVEIAISGDDDKTSVDVQTLFIEDTKINIGFYFEPNKQSITITKNRSSILKDDNNFEEFNQMLESEIKSVKYKIQLSDLKKSSKEYIILVEELNTLKKKRDLLTQNKDTDSVNNLYYFEIHYDKVFNMKEIVEFAISKANFEHRVEYDKIQNGGQPSKKFADLRGIKEDHKIISDSFGNFFDYVTEFSSVVYLDASSLKQSALFPIRDRLNALAQSIHEFYQLKVTPGEPAYEFVEKWMKIFEVGDTFKIRIHAGEAYEFKIESNDTEIHLADKGMGSIQAMLLILRLASIIHKTINTDYILTIIIEEPELNLHPALQSKLADMFLEVYEKCYHDFIIETHSEYLLRRSQVIVAEKEYEVPPNENPFVVYYFPKDLKQQPYRLKYQSDGTFDKNFGEGFFDEASSSTLELLKLKRQKKA